MRSALLSYPHYRPCLAILYVILIAFFLKANLLLVFISGIIKVKILGAKDLPVMDRASDLTDAFVEVILPKIYHDIRRVATSAVQISKAWTVFLEIKLFIGICRDPAATVIPL